MGWKASCVFVLMGAENPFLSSLQHNPAQAEQCRQTLGLAAYEKTVITDFNSAIYPREKALHIGAYGTALIIAEDKLAGWLIEQDKAGKMVGNTAGSASAGKNLLAAYPQATILALVLHSVVNLWGFAWYENGQLQRATWGASDEGLMLDFGKPLEEELPFRAESDWQDTLDGEDLCFTVTKRILGQRLDMYPLEQLQLQSYQPVKAKFWPFTLFKR